MLCGKCLTRCWHTGNTSVSGNGLVTTTVIAATIIIIVVILEEVQNDFSSPFCSQHVLFLPVQPAFIEHLLWAQACAKYQHK